MTQRRIIYFLIHILMVVGGSLATLASGSMDVEWQKATSFALGTSITAAGLCGMVVWVYIAISEKSLDLLRVLEASGLQWIYPSRAAQIRQEYAMRLEKARKRIDIVGFGLKDFKRDYMDQLGDFSKSARVRILVLDPSSTYATQRDREEGQSEGVIRGEIDEFITRFEERYGSDSDRLQLRKYTSLPEVNIFRIDDEIFWGPYLAGRASGNTFTMRVQRGGFMFDALVDHFDSIWNDFSDNV